MKLMKLKQPMTLMWLIEAETVDEAEAAHEAEATDEVEATDEAEAAEVQATCETDIAYRCSSCGV